MCVESSDAAALPPEELGEVHVLGRPSLQVLLPPSIRQRLSSQASPPDSPATPTAGAGASVSASGAATAPPDPNNGWKASSAGRYGLFGAAFGNIDDDDEDDEGDMSLWDDDDDDDDDDDSEVDSGVVDCVCVCVMFYTLYDTHHVFVDSQMSCLKTMTTPITSLCLSTS